MNKANRRAPTAVLHLLFIVFVSACCCRASTNVVEKTRTNSPPVHAVVHVPRELHRFTTWQKLNPVWWFGNADDPIPPKSYRPGKRWRTFTWHLRNPFHNFTFYVIGIADKPFLRVGRYADRVANPNGGWNWAICHYQWLHLPFVDYRRGRFEFYWGWRNGGNFGMKLNFAQKRANRRITKLPDKEAKSRVAHHGCSLIPATRADTVGFGSTTSALNCQCEFGSITPW